VGGMDLTERIYPTVSAIHSCGASTDLAVEFLGGAKMATTLSTACSSATNAIIYGANLIRSGKEQCVVCGGSESLSAYHFHGFNSLMILDREPCRPFDATRAGLNLGEGAAYLVLETEESALRRGVKPIAVLSGWGNACDAFHQTTSSPDGEGAFLAMKEALSRAGIEPSAIDYINAHGTGTPNNDASESAAIRRIFGDALPPVSSTKSFTGHTTSASGSIKAVFCLLALQNGFVPQQLNWSNPDPACIIPQTEPIHKELRHILSNAFGFGGNDSSLILSAYDA
ncbi:MAG: beta-ketoacyl-[Bacteroidales bacterium]|nr:beta-ketoacyl-[acyl-carrier-protein] synthase family protein [Bacteroidales bacterium]